MVFKSYDFIPASQTRSKAIDSTFIYDNVQKNIEEAAKENKRAVEIWVGDIIEDVVENMVVELTKAGYIVKKVKKNPADKYDPRNLYLLISW